MKTNKSKLFNSEYPQLAKDIEDIVLVKSQGDYALITILVKEFAYDLIKALKEW